MRKYTLMTIVIVFLTFFIGGLQLEAKASNGYGWGFKKNTDHKVPDIGSYQDILKKYGSYYADDSGEKNIYLTFDNGYEEGYTDDVLDVLHKEDVPATFFVTGHYVEDQPDLIERMVDEGHTIGNHSYHHPDFTTISKESIKEELESLKKAVAEVSDQKDLKYLRPPKGTFNEETLEWANELGYIHVFWSLAFVDWETGNQKGWEYAFNEIMDQIHPGAIILLHAVSADNAAALEHLIQELREQGYSFKSLDDMVIKDKIPEGIYGF
ncbi:delta-lactam-biosynthetic de-N-acetylase [Virgibacillus sp. NKC19-3]|uniref:delta-lactam-biosynthetic de-N-acetylase n=1 Tax=Virgibacillus saliphilus TaxID=2831674 RepID=UPI001C9AAF74|nr:delta-lactam-biosynthetic de-N-acetylase [Virgibacillus sp. NKC19-3]MBY7142735.1 delta-lactam-biosynthetic de-N-acetylase [Virgibacillus sp. NKC19-3]